ncbi:hypothetical protein POVWA2_031110 [Plasmodium ovale wallikeri]|uniref:Uncharacterized protein n=1 Tax=Plasmodium ovale wallikeri TaxID=864142 RepID=A0A1A8YXP4_PLAOA|nr:hypothetical protein POVWA1_031390 [Plasmodium ovale wallikeri]SBT36628.1 hypothetical protein POVWA2_031110 [Plasmodium ovale wallikeri]
MQKFGTCQEKLNQPFYVGRYAVDGENTPRQGHLQRISSPRCRTAICTGSQSCALIRENLYCSPFQPDANLSKED